IGASFVVGYVLGGKDAHPRTVLGLGTAQRNVSAATVVATQGFGDPDTLIMVVVTSLVGLAILFPIATKLRERTESRKTPHGHTPSKRFELRPARSSVGQPTSVQRGQHGPDSSYAPLARLLDG